MAVASAAAIGASVARLWNARLGAVPQVCDNREPRASAIDEAKDDVSQRSTDGVADEVAPHPASADGERDEIVLSQLLEPRGLPELTELDQYGRAEAGKGDGVGISPPHERKGQHGGGGPERVARVFDDEGGK